MCQKTRKKTTKKTSQKLCLCVRGRGRKKVDKNVYVCVCVERVFRGSGEDAWPFLLQSKAFGVNLLYKC